MTYPVKGTPKPHQLMALQEANLKDAHAWFMDPGAGKTFTSIAEAGKLYKQREIDGVMVIAPLGPHRQWVTEQFPLWADYPWHGTYSKAKSREITAFFERSPKLGLGVLAVHYDTLRTKGGKAMIDKFLKRYPRTYLVIDESQKIKNPKAARTVETESIARRCTHRRELSGTPILKGLEDLFSQFYVLRPGITGPFATSKLNRNWYALRNYYCQLAPIPGQRTSVHAKRIVGYKNEEEFREKIRPYSTRVTSDMFMKGEKPDFIPVEAPMSDNQERAYVTMKNLLLTQIEGGVVTAQNALVQLGKLHQIASGFIIGEDGEVEWLGDNKIDATMTLIEGLAEPVVIWTPFIALKERIVEELEKAGAPVIEYTGLDDVDRWKRMENGIIVGNQSSGLGVGMNLQHAAANIYPANSFSSEARWQSLKRTDRIGQTRQVRNWDLIAPGTTDEKALASLAVKEDIASRNIDGLKDMLLP